MSNGKPGQVLHSGTQFVGGPLDGRAVPGVNMHNRGDVVTVGGARYIATGGRTAGDYWEAVYKPLKKGANRARRRPNP